MRLTRCAAILLAAGSLAVAGCFGGTPPPPPPTQVCGQSFGSASQYQTSFYNLGQTGTGWITSDGFVPPVLPDGRAQLPDGRVVWWMSDTKTGTANPNNSVSNPGNVHDSTLEQGAGCLTPHLTVIPYNDSVWYWPGSAVVVGSTLQVFSTKVVPDSSQPYPYNWRVVGTSVTSFSLPSLQLAGAPADMPVLHNATGEIIPWGIRSFFNSSDGDVYLYGTAIHPTSFVPAATAWLARVPAAQVTNQSQWQFFTDAPAPTVPWSSNFADAKPMEFTKNGSSDSSPLAQLSVVPYGTRYLAGAFVWDTVSPDIKSWVSDTPWGPWVQQATTTATFQPRTTQQFAYDAHVVNLPGASWTVVYSVDDPYNQNQDFTLYRGQFATPSGLPLP